MLALISFDPYQALGISKDAEFPRIKKAYLALAMKTNPDRDPEQKRLDEFLKIREAYEVLRDPMKRKQYDESQLFKDSRQGMMEKNLPSKSQTQRSSWKGPAEVAHRETPRNAVLRSNSRRPRDRKPHPLSPDMVHVNNRRGKMFGESVYSSCSGSDSSSDPNAMVAARKSRRRVQEGIYSTASYHQRKPRDSSVKSRVSSRNGSLGGGRHFESDYQQPEFARRRSGSGSDYEIRRSSPGLPPRPSLRRHRKRNASQSSESSESQSYSYATTPYKAASIRARTIKTTKKHVSPTQVFQPRVISPPEFHEYAVQNYQSTWSCCPLDNWHDAFCLQEGRSYICLLCGEQLRLSMVGWHTFEAHLTIKHKFSKTKRTRNCYKDHHFMSHLMNFHVARGGWWTRKLIELCEDQRVSRKFAATNDFSPFNLSLDTGRLTHPVPEKSSAAVPHEVEKSDTKRPTPEYQKCYICKETIKLTGRRAWQIHVFKDLKPYQCLEETCPQADTTYASLQELRKHYAKVHALAEIQRAQTMSCPFCNEEMTSSDLHTRFRHVGRHMEDIAFAVVPRQFEDWTFYSESSADSSHGLRDFDGALSRLPSPKAELSRLVAGGPNVDGDGEEAGLATAASSF